MIHTCASPITDPVGYGIRASQCSSGVPSSTNTFNSSEWTCSDFLCWNSKNRLKKAEKLACRKPEPCKSTCGWLCWRGGGVAICKLFECICFTYPPRYVRIQILICILPVHYYKWYLRNHPVYPLNKHHLILGQITKLLELTKQFILSFCSLRFSASSTSASYLQTNNEGSAQQEWRDCRSGVCGLLIAQSHSDGVWDGFRSLKDMIQCHSNTWHLGSLIYLSHRVYHCALLRNAIHL